MSFRSMAKAALRPLPQWAPVGIAPPQLTIRVSFVAAGCTGDVTRSHSIASLQPLTVAIRLDGATRDIATGTLEFTDVASGKAIGVLRLGRTDVGAAGEANIGLFRVIGSEQRCLSWPRRPWNAMLQNRAIRRYRKPFNFYMPPEDVQRLMTYYICPRPVVLVSVVEESHSNIFPMDLIGPLGAGQFALALRNTSVSVATMLRTRRIAISGIRAEHKDIAYRLGEHHKREFVDWDKLPFPTVSTEAFDLPAVGSALWIKELVIDASEVIGSHTFMLCRIVSNRELAGGLQLHHTAGFHQEYRRKRGDPYAPA